MSLNPWVAAVGGLVVVSALWRADHAMQESDRLVELNHGLARELYAMTAALDSQTVLREALDKIDLHTQSANVALARQTAQMNRNLEELKRTNEEVRTYLGSPVPAAIGVRHARPETTDPVAYRAGAVMQSSALSSPGTSTVGDQ